MPPCLGDWAIGLGLGIVLDPSFRIQTWAPSGPPRFHLGWVQTCAMPYRRRLGLCQYLEYPARTAPVLWSVQYLFYGPTTRVLSANSEMVEPKLCSSLKWRRSGMKWVWWKEDKRDRFREKKKKEKLSLMGHHSPPRLRRGVLSWSNRSCRLVQPHFI